MPNDEPSERESAKDEEETSDTPRTILTLVGRWMALVTFAVGSFSLGYTLAKGLIALTEQQADWLREGVPVLGIGILLAVLQQTLDTIPNVAAYLKGGEKSDLLAPCGTFFLITTTIVLALNLVHDVTAAEPAGGTIVVWDAGAGLELARGDPGGDARPGPLLFPILFPEEAAGFDPATGRFAVGTELSRAAEEQLAYLARGLRGCAAEGDDGSVKLTVYGFASSSSFSGLDEPAARERNLLAAQARAEAVVAAMRRELGDGGGVSLEVKRWASYDEMAGRRRLDDGARRSYSADAGTLNRRAEVHLDAPGGCRVVPAYQD